MRGEALQRKRGRRPKHCATKGFTQTLIDAWRQQLPETDCTEHLTQTYIMRIGRLLENVYDRKAAEDHGISGPEFRVLLTLRHSGFPYARRPTDLFRLHHVTPSAVTKQVDRLQAAGFVVRLPDPDFNGGTLIQLTEEGKRAAERGFATIASGCVVLKAMSKLTPQDKQELLRLCEIISRELDNEDVS